ncbi:glycine zipper family protein [Methylobacter sp. S3L5C]|uniref:glycine zipper family protein n=1 Tax=Methylobacter sp. S3L5C TaxID=2839024 RepID=UPI001FABFB17|nr:glycine zipper family protein [Methylobacter sp. S3L5C]UOA07292.1 hypothetical protein KKZ03_13435 [Methylobacter sp. S3L5C]
MSRFIMVISITIILAVTGCVSMPSGPSVMVLPGSGMSFERFSTDNSVCQQFASFQVGGTTANQAQMSSGFTSAAVGTAVGAAAGAAIGAASGNAAAGAAIGSGTGLIGGSMVGVGKASSSYYEAQQRYDTAYIQCMYAKGHQVPVSGQFSGAIPKEVIVLPPPTLSGPSSSEDIPPPPSGSPPPAPHNSIVGVMH